MRKLFWLYCIILLSFTGCTGKPRGIPSNITIRFGVPGPIEWYNIYKEIVEEFEKVNPNIKVKMQNDEWSTFVTQKIKMQLAGGTAPDVWIVDLNDVKEFAKRGALLNLDEFAKRDIDYTLHFKKPFESFSWKGHLYALPYLWQSDALFYNKDIFDKYHVGYPDESWDWEQLLEVAKYLTRDFNRDGRIDLFGLFSDIFILPHAIIFVRANGGEYLSSDRKHCLLGSREAIESLQFMYDLENKYRVSPKTSPAERSERHIAFEAGNIAMGISGSYMVSLYRERIKNFNWDIAPVPKNKKRACNLNGIGMAITSTTKYPEQSWELAKFLLRPDIQAKLSQAGLGIPMNLSAAYSEAYLVKDAPPRNIRIFPDSIKYARDMDICPSWSMLQEVFRREMERVRLGEFSLKDGVIHIVTQINRILEEESQ